MHRIIRMNPRILFELMLDGIEVCGAAPVLPEVNHFVITAISLEHVPEALQRDALILRTPDVRQLEQ